MASRINAKVSPFTNKGEYLLMKSVFIHGKDQETSQIVSEQKASIAALVKGLESIDIIPINGSVPDGCGAFVVSEQCNVYMLVKV